MYSTAQLCNYLRQLYSQAVKFIEIGFFYPVYRTTTLNIPETFVFTI